MSFVLHCYSTDRLEISSDAGHQFAFHVVPAGKRRHLKIDRAQWQRDAQPPRNGRVLLNAMRFARLCAKDCGLA